MTAPLVPLARQLDLCAVSIVRVLRLSSFANPFLRTNPQRKHVLRILGQTPILIAQPPQELLVPNHFR
jgi:hypothetical protein